MTARKPKIEKTDILFAFATFKKEIEEKKPDISDMKTEVEMMDYHVVPVMGNLADANMSQSGFIENLWKLGKLEEFFRTIAGKTKNKDKRLLFGLIDSMKNDITQALSKEQILQSKTGVSPLAFELHLLRGKGQTKN